MKKVLLWINVKFATCNHKVDAHLIKMFASKNVLVTLQEFDYKFIKIAHDFQHKDMFPLIDMDFF